MSVFNKVALITGAASGIGKATAIECLKKGIKVSIVDTNFDLGEKVLEELRGLYGNDNVIYLRTDVTSESEFEEAFESTIEAFGKINIVVNNSAIWDENRWMKMIEVNLMGVIRGTKLGIKYMSKNEGYEGGVIVNISSLAGIEVIPFFSEYCASKFGVLGYSLSCARNKSNLEKHGIRINVICPGKVQTPLMENMVAISAMANTAPSIQPSVVAGAILFVIEDETRNGLIVQVNDEEKYTIIKQTNSIIEVIKPKSL